MTHAGPNTRFAASVRRDQLEQFDKLCELIGVSRTQGLEMAIADVLRKCYVKTPLLGWPEMYWLDPAFPDPGAEVIESGGADTNPLLPKKELVNA